MVARKKKSEESVDLMGNYFVDDKPLKFISTGCTVLDCTIGGGLPLGRISNFVGDKSSNKTGIAIEAAASFRRDYPNGYIFYIEAESAFDIDYAKKLGMPTDDKTVIIQGKEIVEEINEIMFKAIAQIKEDDAVGLLIIDSLDAIKVSYDPAIESGYDAAQRAKLFNNMFNKLSGELSRSNVHLLVISQIRDNVGVTFGEKHRRSGGRGLDFNATQIVWLAMTERIKKTIRGIERPIGIWVKANCKKNKIAPPFRIAEFPVIFDFGIDDVTACLYFLKDVKGALEEFGIDKKDVETLSRDIYENKDTEFITRLKDFTKKTWLETEEGFLLKAKKYE